jgi:hypothetical protein
MKERSTQKKAAHRKKYSKRFAIFYLDCVSYNAGKLNEREK